MTSIGDWFFMGVKAGAFGIGLFLTLAIFITTLAALGALIGAIFGGDKDD